MIQDRVIGTLERLTLKGRPFVTTAQLAAFMMARTDKLEAVLDRLFIARKVVLTTRGWSLPLSEVSRVYDAKGITPELSRLASAIANASPDITLTGLANRAKIPRSRIRASIDALIAKGIFKECADGWYE